MNHFQRSCVVTRRVDDLACRWRLSQLTMKAHKRAAHLEVWMAIALAEVDATYSFESSVETTVFMKDT
jgi:hypothetical protein